MRIILCGPGASGKDFLKKRFQERGFISSISYTTRPPRNNEQNGVDYLFISDEKFTELIDSDEFLEWNEFPTVINNKAVCPRYGTTKTHFDNSTLFIMTPSGINKLTAEQRNSSMVIYLNISEDVRRARMANRIGGDDINTRIDNDNKDFMHFVNYDVVITNPDF
jgi:guanylate kinase